MNGDKKKTLRDYFSSGILPTFGDKSADADIVTEFIGGKMYQNYGTPEEQYLGELLNKEAYQVQLLNNNPELDNLMKEYYNTLGVFGYVSPEQDTTYYHGGRGKSTDEGFSRRKLRFYQKADLLKGLSGQDSPFLDEYYPIDLEEGRTINDFIDEFSGFRDMRSPLQEVFDSMSRKEQKEFMKKNPHMFERRKRRKWSLKKKG